MLPTEKEKLNSILNEIIKLGLTTLTMNQFILEPLENCDTCTLNEIEKLPKKERYDSIDKIDNLIINVFALYTPEARDLRELVAFLKITNEFDRIANSCNSFIRDFPKALTDEVDKNFILEYALPLQKSSVNALTHALKLLELDDKKTVDEHYKLVVVEESKNDDLYKIIEKSLLKKINNDMHLSKDYQDIMAALRRLEKIADRALSIANLMHYAKVGGEITKI
ncbi:MAG: PhoU family transcriptional regulator [gamma proteobacterium symbiont of Bathyaustriella thionipta]|nr:PhoU family transcriptional regulator [gamma proteobacterium symbiont of Bathyaustriella thionipta]MCU7951040.1 PhoU family transcriptional regulator [gamma proteobacterium symbiont of Bathyaustriella thionipta]MCU7951977.1 PhoU family transcriptional regulator [gamma proteobacterium symbiont of Bathyaustriella thionipta]MCU7957556.1 PhoU family transcriptional regulator [gamma proteobacterium symbiont of Bathyaustriella thionipta]MCU7967643.1 PhoU family transcriptional regulator [gamma pro